MARHGDAGIDFSQIFHAAAEWRDNCLIADGSIFSLGSVWTTEHLNELEVHFVNKPDESSRTFLVKLEDQLKPVSVGAKKLAAEMYWVLRLFTNGVGGELKAKQVREILAWAGTPLPKTPYLEPEVLIGIGEPGLGFSSHIWREMAFLIGIAQHLKAQSIAKRRNLLADPWSFGEWLLNLPDGQARMLRPILCYLLFPDHYERIASRKHKANIAKAFSERIGLSDISALSPVEIDKRIFEIRRVLEAEHPGTELDFYREPLADLWSRNGADDGVVEVPKLPAKPIDDQIKPALDEILVGYGKAKTRKFGGKDVISKPFNDLQAALSEAVGNFPSVKVKWSAGKGVWASVPWVALLDARVTDTTQRGVYAVILFRTDSSGFYLTLNQGVTEPREKIGSAKAREFLADVRNNCAGLVGRGFSLDNNIDLKADGDLGRKYELSTIAHKFYEAGRVPHDAALLADINELLGAYDGYILGQKVGRKKMPTVSLSVVQKEFSQALLKAGITFGDRQDAVTRAFIASLATKRLVILTGLSGSGKTQIAIKFGEWLCSAGRYRVLPVRPDWNGPEAILGYEDALRVGRSNRRLWHVPPALEFILSAAADLERPYLLILDEMNLAHVERYFADLLSGIESGKACIPNLQKGEDGWYAKDVPEIAVPSNLFIVGTVNIDETTYMFSPKVLDRSNTIEFRVHSSDLNGHNKRPVTCAPADNKLASSFLAIAQDGNWHTDNRPPWIDAFQSDLRKLHDILGKAGFEFGHRVYFEASRFAAIHLVAGDKSLESALDLQVMQKILPRLHGARRQLEPTLSELGLFCFGGTDPKVDLFTLDPENARLPLSAAKVIKMLKNLRANQFTSFTD